MSLVANYSSDSESSDVEEQQQPQKRSLASLLPEPKKVVYVNFPKPEEDEEEENRIKRAKTSTTGFSLADLLPAPKNSKHSVPTNTFITPPIKKKEATPEPVEEPIEEPIEEPVEEHVEENEEHVEEPVEKELRKKHVGPFFHIGKDLVEEPILPSKPKIIQPTTTGLVHTVEKPKEVENTIDYDYDPNAMYSTDPSAYYYYQQQQQYQQQYEEPEETEDMDDLQHLLGHRMRGEHNIQIKSVNQSDMLPTLEERTTQDLMQAPVFDDGPSLSASKLQLRNNNIMALAAHAVNNKEKLDNMFAEQKKTRRDAAKKYGF